MTQAQWHNSVIAESDHCIEVEGNAYFPPETVQKQYLRSSDLKTHCGWKGEASYYDLVVDGEVNEGAAWYYPEPKDAAKEIAGYIAFWKGVVVKD